MIFRHHLLSVITLGLFSVLIPSSSSGQTTPSGLPSTVRVTAEAVAHAIPDQAVVQIGISTDADSAQKAAGENARKEKSVVDAIQNALGAKARVETTQYSLQPRQQFPQQGGSPTVTGYGAQNTVSATVSDLHEVGHVIDLALAAGADNVQGVTFAVKNEQPARTEALEKAVARARSEADALAAGLDLKVRRVLSVEEGPPPIPGIPGRPEYPRAESTTVPPLPGAVEFHSSVVLTAEVGRLTP